MAAVLLAPSTAMAASWIFSSQSSFDGNGYIDATNLYLGTDDTGTEWTDYGSSDNVYGTNSSSFRNDLNLTFSEASLTGIYGIFLSSGSNSTSVTVSLDNTRASYVYGAQLNNGDASNITVTISDGSTITNNVRGVYSGGTSNVSGDASGVTVTVTGSTVNTNVYGADINGNASGIEVTVSGSTTGRIYGAYAASATAEETADTSTPHITVTVEKGTDGTATTASYVYGAFAMTGDASGIEVTVSDSTISNSVYGAWTDVSGNDDSGNPLSGEATDTVVKITNSTVGDTVYGAYVRSGSASGITVEISNDSSENTNTIGAVYGALVDKGDATEDITVNVSNSTITGAVYGAYSGEGSASNTKVTLDNISSSSVHGGYSKGAADSDSSSAAASNNAVTIKNGSVVTGFVHGGANENGETSGNTVTIDGSSVTGRIFAGRSLYTSETARGSGDASGNTVTITNGSTITLTVAGNTEAEIVGGYAGNGEASGNSVSIDNSTVINGNDDDTDSYILGGASGVGGGDVYENSVTITDSTITSDVSGGYAQLSGDAYSNTVTVTADSGTTTVSGTIYGGESYSGKVYDNSVEITDATVDFVYGGVNRSADDVSGNTVTIKSSTAKGVSGGVSNGAGAVSGNSVTISDSTVGNEDATNIIAGGNSESGAVSGNSVTIDNSTVTGSIFGGTSGGMDEEETATGGASTSNTITLNSGTVKGDVIAAGHSGGTGDVTGNTVTLNAAEITSDTFAAGYSNGSGTVSGNTIDINGGTLSGGYTYAGYSSGGGAVSGNTINLNAGTVSGTLYAGYSNGGTVSGNTINLDGANGIDVKQAILFGSNLDITGTDGNTLNIKNFSGRIQNIGYFDNINIDLTGLDMANAVYGSGSIITLTDSDKNGTYLVNSDVNIYSSTVRNSLSVAFTSESGLSDEYTVVANESSSMDKTGATITERIIVVQDPNVYSDSIQYSEYTLVTDDDRTISYIIDPSTTGVYPPGSDNPINSNEGKTVAALGGIGNKLSMHYAQLDDLRKRLGEVRYGAQDGLWARYIYQRNSYDGVSSSTSAKQNMHAINLGLDHIVTQDEDSMWLLGGNLKYGHDNEKVRSVRGKGNMNSYGLNLYATYANQFGCYTDLVLSFDQYHQKIGAKLEDNSSSNGNFNTWGWGASIEVGKMFSSTQNDENWGPWHNHWWVEPQAQLSYYWIKGKDWSMNNGMNVKQNHGDSLVGRLGVVVGKQWSYGGSDKVDKRYVQAYLKGGVKHEFLGNQKTRINNTTFDHKLRGTAGYYGAGVDWNLTKQIRAYAQVERDAGGRYKKDIEASVGLKWQF